MKTKIIVVTGGVYSSLGKGIVAASIGRILKEFGFKISMQKLDPYLNVDPGTLSPYQHGEVFVTKDGGETDLDLGHYERFIDHDLNKYSSVTSGKVYSEVLNNERSGKYNGSTVQVIPHITNMIQENIKRLIKADKPDFLIIEVGGTIGDIESLPFIEALRSFASMYPRKDVMFIHCSPLIKIQSNGEIKTKPTQHSVKTLMNLGIRPDVLVLRTDTLIGDDIKQKLAWTCDIDKQNIFCSLDCETIYEVPKVFYDQNIHKSIFKYFKINKKGNINNWEKFLRTIYCDKKYKAKIAIVGKYTELPDAYLSLIESLKISAYKQNTDLDLVLVAAQSISEKNYKTILKSFDGIVVPGGFGLRGIEGKTLAARYCRENNIPYLGICLGMQTACIDFAKNVLDLKTANSTEFDSKTEDPIFDIMEPSKKDLGGTLRVGNFEVDIKPNTLASKVYKKPQVVERHRHRFSFNRNYIEAFEKAGFIVSGLSTNKKVVEIMELKNHKFFIGVQYHPEFQSRPLNPNPLFEKLIETSKKN